MSEEVDLTGPVVLDMGDISDDLVAEGWHAVTIEKAEASLSRKQQIPQVFVMARISDEADPEFKRTIIWNLMLEGAGRRFTKRCFKALGLPERMEYPSYQALAEDLVGLEVEARVKHGSYNGEAQVRVNSWRPISDIPF